MSRSVTVFSGEMFVEVRIQSEERPDSTSLCVHIGNAVLAFPLTDTRCDEALAHLMAQRAYRVPPEGENR